MRISIDDGCASDMRLADLALKHEIELVCYLPVEWHSLAYDMGYEPLSYDQALQLANTFEIGSHTITHRHLTKLPYEAARYEIVCSKIMLEQLFPDHTVTKFCPPRGYTNQTLTDGTLSVYESQRLTKGDHLVHIHPNSGANGNKPWREAITDKTTELWGHSHELDKFNLWGELEQYLEDLPR